MSFDVGATPLDLPLVSVIIVTHNYGRFLKQAIGSVCAQTYGPVECIVVDDCSADDTSQILAEVTRNTPSIKVVINQKTLGQGASSRIGLKVTRGQYVVFMDADDVLMPDFILEHIYVHLASRIHVGFTSSDIYQTVDGRLVLGAGAAIGAYVLANPPASADHFRPLA